MLDEEVVSAVAIGNLKAIAEQPAMYSNMAYSNSVANNNLGQQNAVSNQQSVNELGISVVAKGSNTVSNLDPLFARSAVDVLTNDELAQTIADMKAVLIAFADEAGGGKGGKALLAKLKALLRLGIEILPNRTIVIEDPKPLTTVVFKGSFKREDMTITVKDNETVIELKT